MQMYQEVFDALDAVDVSALLKIPPATVAAARDADGLPALHHVMLNGVLCVEEAERLVDVLLGMNCEPSVAVDAVGVGCVCDDQMGFKNVTALHCACTQPSPALLSYLLRCGFDASEGTTNSVPSSLFFALLADTPACLEFLLHHGFSLDQHGNFLSLLHLLIILHKTSSFHRFLSFFLAHGLTLNAQTASGDSYLHLAVRYHNTEAIAALIAHHINQTLTNKRSLTAYQLAEQIAAPSLMDVMLSVYRVPLVVVTPISTTVRGDRLAVRWKPTRFAAIPAVEEYQVEVTNTLLNQSVLLPAGIKTNCGRGRGR